MSPFTPASLLPGHPHSGRAQDLAPQRVALPEHVSHHGLALALRLRAHQRLVPFGVERPALGLDPFQALRPEYVPELRVHELDPPEELFEVGGPFRGHEGQVELVQNLEQAPHERLRRALQRVRLLPEGALAEVVELGGETLEVLAVLGGFLLGLGQTRWPGGWAGVAVPAGGRFAPAPFGRRGPGGPGPAVLARGIRRVPVGTRCARARLVLASRLFGVDSALVRDADLWALGVGAEPGIGVLPRRLIFGTLILVVGVVGHYEASPSSTISPSTTSSELSVVPGAEPASADVASPPAACWAWYMAGPTFWKDCRSRSAAGLMASVSSPLRASLASSFAFVSSSRSDSGILSPYS